MDEELQKRFMQRMLDDLYNDCTKPFPTYLFEMDPPKITELVRKFCLFTRNMVPFKAKDNLVFVPEGLDIQREGLNYGMLYVEVFVN